MKKKRLIKNMVWVGVYDKRFDGGESLMFNRGWGAGNVYKRGTWQERLGEKI